MYVCASCKREFSDKDFQMTFASGGSVRCTYCGGKALFKKTPPVVRTVKAV